MDNAKKISCDLLFNPCDEKYSEKIREFQGCPTIAITKGGRIFMGWYSGGICEPHMDNYNLLIYSDDKGGTWSEPIMIIPSNKEKRIHSLDIQLWVSPEGKLFVFWVQNNVVPVEEGRMGRYTDGYLFNDRIHAEWVTVCDDPDAEKLSFSQPRYLDQGFLRCKPLVTQSGRWINFNYSKAGRKYQYSISDDKGNTYRHMEGVEKIPTPFDESMAYQKKDGSIRMFARSYTGQITECTSFDDGETWTEAKMSGIDSPSTRFYVSRTPSGRIILVNNDERLDRNNMTVYLSEDDGVTWKYKRCIDPRTDLSYPDVDFYDGRIYLTYDRERMGAKEILFTSFTEEDVMNEDYEFDIKIVSKP